MPISTTQLRRTAKRRVTIRQQIRELPDLKDWLSCRDIAAELGVEIESIQGAVAEMGRNDELEVSIKNHMARYRFIPAINRSSVLRMSWRTNPHLLEELGEAE